MQSVHTLLKLAQLRWTGHVTRMPDERLQKKVLYEDLQEGKSSQGGQQKRYIDTLKVLMKDFNSPTEYWEQNTQDRIKWRCLIRKGTSQYKAKRICEAERVHKDCKAKSRDHHQCYIPRLHSLFATVSFRATIGLNSHQRSHNHT